MASSTASPEVNQSPAEETGETEETGSIDLPTKQDEAWRYAPHDELSQLRFGLPSTAVEVPVEVEERIPPLDGPRIVIVNGVVDQMRSDLGDLPAGLVLSPLAPTLAEPPEPVAAHFGPGVDDHVDAFVTFNRAYGGNGAFVQVADGHHLDTPIHVVDITVPGQGPNASCTGVVIHLGDRSSATVVETRIGAGTEFGGSNTRTTIHLDPGAVLDHLMVQDLPTAQVHLGRVEVTQATESELRVRSFNLGARYGRLAYDVHLAGEGARADLSGLYFGLGDQTLDQQIRVVHGAKDCTSRQSFRGVLDEMSTGVFNGGIDVRPGADGTDAEQSNDNLVLSDRAEVNTQPRLEILADDVACKHGATVGQLDASALYYLRSRGISADEARRLLINGFVDQVVDLIDIEAVRNWIAHRLGHDHA